MTPSFLHEIWRKKVWFFHYVSTHGMVNAATAAVQFASRASRLFSFPAMLKVDITPLCNLRCKSCLHGEIGDNPNLQGQDFHKGQFMPVNRFEKIIEESRKKVMAMSLYYVGDPLMHPDLAEMCSIAKGAGISTHISTNFSFALSEDRIVKLLDSGLDHLTVCVDGLQQHTYELTRVGGRLDLVLKNLRTACEYKQRTGNIAPRIEVQYIMFPHNIREVEEARRLFSSMKVDRFTTLWGNLYNYTDLNPDQYKVFGPKGRSVLPGCYWPYFLMLIKYNGDAIPCCFHRVGEQYSASEAPVTLGNVFETSMEEVWDSKAYRDLRRLVSNPALVNRETDLTRSFCYGCERVFHTDLLNELMTKQERRKEGEAAPC
jgi:MoaA/NifB/PqqE/SkfB family radical SAM enzyme